LHTSTETQHKVQSRLLLDVVVAQSAAILELLSGEDETLLVRRDAFLILNLGLDVVDGITGLDIEGDSLSSESFDENLLGPFKKNRGEEDKQLVLISVFT